MAIGLRRAITLSGVTGLLLFWMFAVSEAAAQSRGLRRTKSSRVVRVVRRAGPAVDRSAEAERDAEAEAEAAFAEDGPERATSSAGTPVRTASHRHSTRSGAGRHHVPLEAHPAHGSHNHVRPAHGHAGRRHAGARGGGPSILGSIWQFAAHRWQTPTYRGGRWSGRGAPPRHGGHIMHRGPHETVYEQVEEEVHVGTRVGGGEPVEEPLPEGAYVEGEIVEEWVEGPHPAGPCDCCCLIPFPSMNWDNLEIGLGVQGFTGPVNRGETGSFGFHQMANWGMPAPIGGWCGLGAQLGVRSTQSNLSGAEFTTSQRDQLFVTAGLFRRVDWGLQGGVAFDYFHEDWYHRINLTQLRSELSWVMPMNHEFGVRVNTGLRKNRTDSVIISGTTTQVVNELFKTTDLYAFFYRYRDECTGGQARVYGGFSGKRDGLLGTEVWLPLSDRFAVQGGFNYLSPEESTGSGGHVGESWNLGMSVIWYPGCRTNCESQYYRPLFDVADNGSYLVDRSQ